MFKKLKVKIIKKRRDIFKKNKRRKEKEKRKVHRTSKVQRRCRGL